MGKARHVTWSHQLADSSNEDLTASLIDAAARAAHVLPDSLRMDANLEIPHGQTGERTHRAEIAQTALAEIVSDGHVTIEELQTLVRAMRHYALSLR